VVREGRETLGVLVGNHPAARNCWGKPGFTEANFVDYHRAKYGRDGKKISEKLGGRLWGGNFAKARAKEKNRKALSQKRENMILMFGYRGEVANMTHRGATISAGGEPPLREQKKKKTFFAEKGGFQDEKKRREVT